MFGVRHIVLAVNKMDLVAWDRGTFESIDSVYRTLAEEIGLAQVVAIPVSALSGDNVTRRCARTPGTAARACSRTWKRWRSSRRSRGSPSACRSSMSTDRTRTFAATVAESRPATCRPATLCASRPREPRPRSSRS